MTCGKEPSVLPDRDIFEREVTHPVAVDDQRAAGQGPGVRELVTGEPQVPLRRLSDVGVVRVLADHTGAGVAVRSQASAR